MTAGSASDETGKSIKGEEGELRHAELPTDVRCIKNGNGQPDSKKNTSNKTKNTETPRKRHDCKTTINPRPIQRTRRSGVHTKYTRKIEEQRSFAMSESCI
jgi:hypothetical protein